MNFITELLRDKWAINPAVIDIYKSRIEGLINSHIFDLSAKPKNVQLGFSIPSATADSEQNQIAVVELRGVMTRYGGMSTHGTEDIAKEIVEANEDTSVKGIILSIDSPGGSTGSVNPIINALQKITKPKIAFVDDMADSAAYLVASFCDEIWVSNKMAEVGSIGVMAMLVNDKQQQENEGISIIKLFPPESQDKQKAYLDAIDGKPEAFIAEQLTPWAIFFQETVKKNRKKLNAEADGVLSGKTFYSDKALEYGLIDKVGTIEDVIKRIDTMVSKLKILSSIK